MKNNNYSKKQVYIKIFIILFITVFSISCKQNKLGGIILKSEKDNNKTYIANYKFQYEINQTVINNILYSQILNSTDMTIIQNIDNETTVSFQINFSNFKISGNIDTNGNIKELGINDKEKEYKLEWDLNGHRIK
jgi:hypothetical protein